MFPLVKILEIAPISEKKVKNFDGPKQYLTTGNLDESSIKELVDVIYKDKPSRAELLADEGDVVFAKMQNTPKSLLIDENTKDLIFSTGFYVLRPIPERILSSFLFCIFNTKLFLSQKDKHCVGATQKALNNEGFKKIKVPLPPLTIQKSIVERLDVIKKAQELNDKQVTLDNELFQSLLHRELDPKGKNWEIKKIEEAIELTQYGLSKKMNTIGKGYPILRINSIKDGKLTDGKVKYVELSQPEFLKYKLEKGDILFNRTNSFELVGKTGIFNLEGNYVFASYLVRVKTKQDILLPEFLNYFLNSAKGQIAIKRKAMRAIGQANVNARQLSLVKIPLPPLPIQCQIVEKLQTAQDYKKKLLEQKQKLNELFESCLDKAMKGELVSQNNPSQFALF